MAQAAADNKKKKKVFDGRYEILSIVGRGSGSVVYRARHVTAPHTEVALKVLVNKKGGAPSSDQLRKEALAMVSSRHKYTVRLDDFHSVGQLCYLSMEFAPEGDLRKFLARKGSALPMVQIERFMLQVAEALAFIHQAGILHRDIKPENILIVNERQCRLADFGVAVLPGEESSIEELQKGVGTMDYMAPEVLEARECTKQSDVYLYGVTFYEILTGVQPFADIPLAKVIEARKTVKPIKSLRPDCPDAIAKIIARAIAFDTNERYESAREMYEDLLAARSTEEPATQAAPAQKALPLANTVEKVVTEPATKVATPPTQTSTQAQVAKTPTATPPTQEGRPKITPAALLQAAGAEETSTKPKKAPQAGSAAKQAATPAETEVPAPAESRATVTPAALLADPDEEDEKDPAKAATARARRKRRRKRRRARMEAKAKLDGTESSSEAPTEQAAEPTTAASLEPEASAAPNSDSTQQEKPAKDPFIARDSEPSVQRTRPPLKNQDTRNASGQKVQQSQGAAKPAILKPTLDSESKPQEPEAQSSVFAKKQDKPKANPTKQKTSAAMGALFGDLEPDASSADESKITSKKGQKRAEPEEIFPSKQNKKQIEERDQENDVYEPIEPQSVRVPEKATETETVDDGYHEEDFYGSSTDAIAGSQIMISPNMDAKQKSWFLRVLVIVIMIFVADDLSKRWTDKGLAERAIEMTGLSEETSMLPYVSASSLPFPNLPEGQYSGSITGLIKDTPLPLSITRPAGSNELFLTVGLPGWVPARAPVTANASSVRIRSSGLILTFSGVDSGEGVQGTFINDITGEEGTWEVRPLRKR